MTQFNITPETNGASLDSQQQEVILGLARDILATKLAAGEPLSSPSDTRKYLQVLTGGYLNEVFGCIFLDSRHRIIESEELFHGTVDSSAVHPRVVVQRAIAHNAVAVVFFHNHPSGVAEPSASDRSITQRLKDALALIDVRVLDHMVVSADSTMSMAERGIL